MRSDYLGDCSQFRDLLEAVNNGQYLIPRMTRHQQRLAITEPAAVFNTEISPVLVNRLLNDNWKKLNQWGEKEAEDAKTYQRLADRAASLFKDENNPLSDPSF